jgi:ribulose-phosphate 3-epimerase
MTSEIVLSSSILSADFSKLAEQIHTAEEAGVDWIHIDVMDGHFVPNITMGPFIVETCRKITQLPLDVHLMIENPERHVDSFASAGANRLSIHVENNPNLYRTLQYVRHLGCAPAVVVNPGTPASAVSSVLELVDMVLVMTVNPGFSGQEYLPSQAAKVAEIHQMLSERRLSAQIQVDGGITEKTIAGPYRAGARVFVAATAIFKYPAGISAGIFALRQAARLASVNL